MISIRKALESVGPDVRAAFETADVLLEEKGIPHVLIGGLAVNAHGLHYSTRDVDFLVHKDDVFDGDVVITHKPGIPHAVGGVPVDYLTIRDDYPEVVKSAMEDALVQANEAKHAAVVNDGLLVWMKLNAGRTKDLAAVEGLLAGGHIDARGVLDFLAEVDDERVLKMYGRCIGAVEANRG